MCTGCVPAATFEREDGSAQAASPVPVRPVAKLAVCPADFPFLHQVHGHHDDELRTRAAADPGGFPWHR